MNTTVIELEAGVHQKAQKLLPWLAAGTLAQDDLAVVHAHLPHCRQCRDDLDRERTLQAVGLPGVDGVDVERAFDKMRARMAAAPRIAPRGSRWTAVRAALAERGRWVYWALGAQGLALAALSGMLMLPAGAPADYRTLSSAAPGAAPNANLIVIFKPLITERQMRAILQHAGARIVDGPTVTDAYMLSVPPARQGAGLAALRADPAVTLAESLAAPASPAAGER